MATSSSTSSPRRQVQTGRYDDASRLLSMALRKLGQEERRSGIDFFSKFGEREPPNVRQARLHYLLGLVHKAQGEPAAARAEFEKALSLDVNQLWARAQIEK